MYILLTTCETWPDSIIYNCFLCWTHTCGEFGGLVGDNVFRGIFTPNGYILFQHKIPPLYGQCALMSSYRVSMGVTTIVCATMDYIGIWQEVEYQTVSIANLGEGDLSHFVLGGLDMNKLNSIGILLLYITSTYVIGLDKIDYLSAKNFQFCLSLLYCTTATASSSLLQNVMGFLLQLTEMG